MADRVCIDGTSTRREFQVLRTHRGLKKGSTDAVNMKYLGVGAEHDVLRMIF